MDKAVTALMLFALAPIAQAAGSFEHCTFVVPANWQVTCSNTHGFDDEETFHFVLIGSSALRLVRVMEKYTTGGTGVDAVFHDMDLQGATTFFRHNPQPVRPDAIWYMVVQNPSDEPETVRIRTVSND